jgi:hypothetical protein
MHDVDVRVKDADVWIRLLGKRPPVIQRLLVVLPEPSRNQPCAYVARRPSDTTFCTHLARVHFGVHASAVMVIVESYSQVAIDGGLGLRRCRRQPAHQRRHVAEDRGEVRSADLDRDFVVE